jgi:aminopeptidase N
LSCIRNKFELIDGLEHFLNRHKAIISYMKLYVEPNFETRKIECKQNLELICIDDLSDKKLELDCANLIITKIEYNEMTYPGNITELGYISTNEKLIIQLPDILSKGAKFSLNIEYSGFPKRGFHFIDSVYNNHISDQAWTQGEMIESKYWFPCIDEPQIKFRREILVSVPKDFVVISNGKSSDSSEYKNDKKLYKWIEDSPNSTYLTSIVIGKFTVSEEMYNRNENERSNGKHKIKLIYCVPKDKSDRIKRTFEDTPKVLQFFESYLNFDYPYPKYAQTTVKDFEYGGMENTSCTTLQEEFLLDEHVHKNNDNYYLNPLGSSRSIIVHEIAHQWFGDLITFLDWNDTWLNEGFATYAEALYIEHINNNDKNEFFRYLILTQDPYNVEACNDYQRSLVANKYKYPDEIFDRHSYKKGAWILHMLRNYIGETNFKMSLKKYLEKYQYKNVKTSDFMKVLEEISGKDLDLFFKQWVYSPGHPEFAIAFDTKTNSIKVIQTQDKLFSFNLEIKISHVSNPKVSKIYSYNINERESIIPILYFEEMKYNETIEGEIKNRENSSHISKNDKGKIKNLWFTIDPELKILKEIKSYDIPISMIINQIENGETMIDRRQGILSLNNKSIGNEDYDQIIMLLKNVVLNDEFYWVSSIAASKLGEFGRYNIDNEKKLKSFNTIRDCLNIIQKSEKLGKNVILSNLITGLGNYISNIADYDPKATLFNELKNIAKDNNESYYIQGAALITLSNYRNKPVLEILQESISKENTFFDIIPQRAILGLSKFVNASQELKKTAINVLIKKTNLENSNPIRTIATRTLGTLDTRSGNSFLLDENKKINKDVFNILFNCLSDKWPHVRNEACSIFETMFEPDNQEISDVDKKKLLDKLELMANADIFLGTRKNAQLCLFAIRERTYTKIRERAKNEKEFNEYVVAKRKMRTKHVFGPIAI